MASVRGIAEALERTTTISANTMMLHGSNLREAGIIGPGPHLAPHEAIMMLLTASVPVRARATAVPLAQNFLALGTVLPKTSRPDYPDRTGVAGEAFAASPNLEAAIEALVAWAPAWSVLAWSFVAAAHPDWATFDEDQRSAAVGRYYRQPRIELRRDAAGIYARINPLPDLAVPGTTMPGLPWVEAHPRVRLPQWEADENADWQMCNTVGLVTLLTLHTELYLLRYPSPNEAQNAEPPELRHPVTEAASASTLH